mmetsp:Transcript_19051/g.56027  ORF Transcript_19051/g.56027 Transcript_19051/m.56027 type:complete len:231 (-) Transcript_19051:1457-2149(-)
MTSPSSWMRTPTIPKRTQRCSCRAAPSRCASMTSGRPTASSASPPASSPPWKWPCWTARSPLFPWTRRWTSPARRRKRRSLPSSSTRAPPRPAWARPPPPRRARARPPLRARVRRAPARRRPRMLKGPGARLLVRTTSPRRRLSRGPWTRPTAGGASSRAKSPWRRSLPSSNPPTPRRLPRSPPSSRRASSRPSSPTPWPTRRVPRPTSPSPAPQRAPLPPASGPTSRWA